MILAISRFRVANGLEHAVKEAFQDRPRLVESAPGFLGLEVFNESNDASVFVLVTRWTDVSSFRSWHASDAHDRSHASIPGGLKLDAAYTKLTLLDEITAAGDNTAALLSWPGLLAEHLSSGPVTCFLAGGIEGRIHACNARMAEMLEVPEEQLRGELVWRFLADPDAARLRERLASSAGAQVSRLMLNFVSASHVPLSLECTVGVRADSFAVIGNECLRDERALQHELREINSELVVLARERARQSRAIQKARLELEKTLHELSTLYWHMRKIGEVLPICMKCGKVESEEARWEDLLAFMKARFPFLSHGYCPECAASVLREEHDPADSTG